MKPDFPLESDKQPGERKPIYLAKLTPKKIILLIIKVP